MYHILGGEQPCGRFRQTIRDAHEFYCHDHQNRLTRVVRTARLRQAGLAFGRIDECAGSMAATANAAWGHLWKPETEGTATATSPPSVRAMWPGNGPTS